MRGENDFAAIALFVSAFFGECTQNFNKIYTSHNSWPHLFETVAKKLGKMEFY